MTQDHVFNPLSRESLSASVARKLLEAEAWPLSNLEPVKGSGIYAIYYSGDFLPYAPLARLTRDGMTDAPIYVGKAESPGARKGLQSGKATGQSPIRKRLREHAQSIASAATTLKLEDFTFRHLQVEEIWTPLGESTMIRWFEPIWNVVVDGFGNHTPGAGRGLQKASSWDILHPGRGFARDLAKGVDPESIRTSIRKHFVRRQLELPADSRE